MTAPVKVVVQQVHMRHSGGTKEYNVTIVQNKTTGNSVWIKRYGKIGARGEIMCGGVMPDAEAWREFQSVIRQKDKRGYVQQGPARVCNFGPEFHVAVAELRPENGSPQVVAAVHSLMGTDPAVARPAAPDFDTVDDPPATREPEELFGKTSHYAENPDWGSF